MLSESMILSTLRIARNKRGVFLTILFAALGASTAFGQLVGPTRWASPSPDGHLYALAQSDFNGRLWMLGKAGRIKRGFPGDSLQSYQGPSTMDYQSICFSGSQIIVTGYQGNTGRVSFSADNGNTWQAGVMPDSLTQSFSQSLMASPQEAMARDGNGRWYRSSNGGRIWTALPGGTRTTNGKIFAGLQGLWLLAKADSLLRSVDFGNSWQTTQGTSGQIAALKMYSASEGLCAAGEGLYYTADAGQSWVPFATPDQAPQGVSLAENSAISYGANSISLFPRQGGQITGPVRVISSWQVAGQSVSTTGFPIEKLWQLSDSLGYILTSGQSLGLWRLTADGQLQTQLLQQGLLANWADAQANRVSLPGNRSGQRLTVVRPFGAITSENRGKDYGQSGLLRLTEPDFRMSSPIKVLTEGHWHITADASGLLYLSHSLTGRDTTIALRTPLRGVRDVAYLPRLDQPADSLWVLDSAGRLVCWLLPQMVQPHPAPLAILTTVGLPAYSAREARRFISINRNRNYARSFGQTWTSESLYLSLANDSLVPISQGATPRRRPQLPSWKGYHPVGDWFVDSVSFATPQSGSGAPSAVYGMRAGLAADDSLVAAASLPRGFGTANTRLGAMGLFFLSRKGQLLQFVTDTIGEELFRLGLSRSLPLLDNDRYKALFWLVADDSTGQSSLLAITELGRVYQASINAPLAILPFRPVSTHRLSATADWQLFPNPATGQVTIQSPTTVYAFQWLDLTGKSLSPITHLATPATQTTIAVPQKHRGLYMLSILTAQGWSYKRVMCE